MVFADRCLRMVIRKQWYQSKGLVGERGTHGHGMVTARLFRAEYESAHCGVAVARALLIFYVELQARHGHEIRGVGASTLKCHLDNIFSLDNGRISAHIGVKRVQGVVHMRDVALDLWCWTMSQAKIVDL